jgi:hypothetical protein
METTMSFDITVVPASLVPMFAAMESDEQREQAWSLVLGAAVSKLATDKDAKKAARDAAKLEAAKNKEDKRKEVADMCEDLGITPPSLVKSLHRTDKKVKAKDPKTGAEITKTPQVLCGVKFDVEGISGSLDLYISTGKGAKVTDATEVSVTEAHALALRMMAALEEAGFSVGVTTSDDEDETTED